MAAVELCWCVAVSPASPCLSLLRTPLMLAVVGGHVDAVSLLLEREANVNTANSHGLTALHLGVRPPHPQGAPEHLIAGLQITHL